jgi:hypothetical protein
MSVEGFNEGVYHNLTTKAEDTQCLVFNSAFCFYDILQVQRFCETFSLSMPEIEAAQLLHPIPL